MKYLYINGGINNESIEKFITDFNSIDSTEHIKLYLSSDGGFDHYAYVIIDMINLNSSRIELIGSGFIYSAGFNIFFAANCNKRIIEGTKGMAHYASTEFTLDESGRPKFEQDKFIMSEFKRNKLITINNYRKIGLTEAELKKIRDNRECYFSYTRLNELLAYGKEKNR